MENKKLLYLNRILAFIAFLFAFGRLCYELGSNKEVATFSLMFILAAFFLLLLIISLVSTDTVVCPAVAYSKKPYIIAACISIGFIILMGIIYLITILSSNTPITTILTPLDIIYTCTITLISLAIGIIYLLLALKFKEE